MPVKTREELLADVSVRLRIPAYTILAGTKELNNSSEESEQRKKPGEIYIAEPDVCVLHEDPQRLIATIEREELLVRIKEGDFREHIFATNRFLKRTLECS